MPDIHTSSAPILLTSRLRLRPHMAGDFDRFAEFYATPRSRYVGGPLARGPAWRGFAAMVGQWPLLGFGAWAIDLLDGGDHVGHVDLWAPEDWPENELGWALWEGFEGHGYAHEAAVRARQYAFQTLGWSTDVSYIDPDNEPSRRLAERLGASLDGQAATPPDRPCVVYRHPPPDSSRAKTA